MLTETQLDSFTALCRVMDGGILTTEQVAVNAHAIGIPWRHICTLTGLTGDALHRVLKTQRAHEG